MLLEAGPDYRADTLPPELVTLSKAIDWPHDWRNEVTSILDRRLFYGRGRVVGGSSQTNGGVAIRAEPADFASMPPGWRYDDLLPAFCRSEHDLDFGAAPYHGDAGPIPIVRWPRDTWAPLQRAFFDASRALGHESCADHNAPGTSGVGPIPMNRVERRRMRVAPPVRGGATGPFRPAARSPRSANAPAMTMRPSCTTLASGLDSRSSSKIGVEVSTSGEKSCSSTYPLWFRARVGTCEAVPRTTSSRDVTGRG